MPGVWPQGASGTGSVKGAVKFSVPAGAGQVVLIDLPLTNFGKWLARSGKANYGLLVKLQAGTQGAVRLSGSAYSDLKRRPEIRVEYDQK